MNKPDFTQVELLHLITHHVGNKQRDESYTLSDTETVVDDDTRDYLLSYFLQPFNSEEYFNFAHTVSLDLNAVNTVASRIFEDPDKFVEASHDLARLLFDQTTHPKVKAGELNIAYFTQVMLGEEKVAAIGIFKSETDTPFLKMKHQRKNYFIKHEFGFELKSMDKGCLIFNTSANDGFRILVSDASARTADTQYWKEDFLNVKPVSNAYHQTTQLMNIAKTYVTQKLAEDFEVNKADQIDLLNRSAEYFKKNDSFNQEQFEEQVFRDKSVIESFRSFDQTYREENSIAIEEDFDISKQAVKKQSRVFKSVLKLDKNFHIYIHGDKQLIERGTEADGRKYYKIYFTEET